MKLESLTATALLVAATTVLAAQPDPRALLEAAQNQGTPKTLQATMTMTLVDSGGREQRRTLEIRKIGNEKQLVWFTKPADLRGTAFLRIGDAKHKKMWLYLPGFKKLDRISGARENEPFLGSDFTYADMGDRDLDLYDHSYAGVVDFDGHKAHKIVSTLKEEDDDALYGKIVSYIDVETGRLLGEDLFDTFGDLLKQKRHKAFKEVQGYHLPTVIEMRDVQKDHLTRLEMTSVKVDHEIPARIFSTQYMKRIRH